MLRVIGEGGASPEFLVELHQQITLTLSFTTMKLCNGHTDQTAAKTADTALTACSGTRRLHARHGWRRAAQFFFPR
jgi:hypothetical protein